MTAKKIKNEDSKHSPEAVGEEVEPVAGALGDEEFLQQFGEAAVGDADGKGEQQGFLLVGCTVGDELLAVAPDACEGEAGIHQEMHRFVEADDGLDVRKNGTRKPCQNQDDDSAQDSRVAISGQSFQWINRSWLRRPQRP